MGHAIGYSINASSLTADRNVLAEGREALFDLCLDEVGVVDLLEG
jgi:hypothetical protein